MIWEAFVAQRIEDWSCKWRFHLPRLRLAEREKFEVESRVMSTWRQLTSEWKKSWLMTSIYFTSMKTWAKQCCIEQCLLLGLLIVCRRQWVVCLQCKWKTLKRFLKQVFIDFDLRCNWVVHKLRRVNFDIHSKVLLEELDF